jgi:hypothetical protein
MDREPVMMSSSAREAGVLAASRSSRLACDAWASGLRGAGHPDRPQRDASQSMSTKNRAQPATARQKTRALPRPLPPILAQ